MGACGGDSHPKNLSSNGGSSNGGTGGSAGADASLGGGGSGGFGGFGGNKEAGTGGKEAGADANPNVDAVHCGNATKDEDESDVDCGGIACPGCDTGQTCGGDSDCASLKCNSATNTCNVSLCTDGVKNGSETDKDCGGPNCPKCGDGKVCAGATDCTNGVCSGTPPLCQAPTCTDGVKNGTEGDKDCGVNCPQKCGLGQSCKGTTDCASANCQTNQCKCPTGMVLAPATGGGAYCIDQYEVSYEQYAVFWQANPPAQITECTWNNSYTPPQHWPAALGYTKYPVRSVDWCDAHAYCNYVGKRLCGKQGGGSVPFNSYNDYTQSQWMNGCSAGANTYCYGSLYNSTLCIGSDYNGAPLPDGGPFDVLQPLPGTRVLKATDPNKMAPQFCQGAAPLLFDMSANAAEWEDSCDGTTGASDNCHVRGGSYKESGSNVACSANKTLPRSGSAEDVGFRCCYP